ncbi:MAG: family 20 glycosylhydrolase [Bacteroidales bacterium]|nr:family 20 glycosylhydrolase [Bacteroidales bacterium]
MSKSFLFLLLVSALSALPAQAGLRHLLPVPQQIVTGKGQARTDLPVGLHRVDRIDAAGDYQDEAYRLVVRKDSVLIFSITDAGAFRALQTLEQLKEGGKRMPVCDITDWAAFRIRGFMHDTGRSFIPLEELKKEIALLSRYKVNTFHWHLTENQAWRLQSRRYPQLNAAENMERQKGLFYTLDEAKELANFCRRHHVLLIPEIDMPGHAAAFERTFGCDMQSERGTAILKELVDEACEAFADVPYLHIGTDEVRFTNKDFVPEMVAYIRAKGKKVISWNPGWSYKPGEIDMTQLWSYRGKAQPGIPAIDCRFHYINHFDLFNDVVALYNSNVYQQATGSADLAGSILAYWNDRYIDNTPQLLADNNFYATMLAFAERTWRGGGEGYFNGRCTLLWNDTPEANRRFADFEERLLWHKDHHLQGEPIPYVRQSQVCWRITDAFPNEGDLSRSFPPEERTDTVFTYQGKDYGSSTIHGAGIYLRHVWGTTVPAFYAAPQENHTAYASTWVYSPKRQNAGLLLEFQNYSRSESDLPPRPGTWDYKGSRAWLNGTELLPPVWENTHTERTNELPLRNENCTSRPPLSVTLEKGWNRLFLKLPVGRFRQPETRLVKWMFTAVFVTPDGQHALEGITYSADPK